jgi:hypothetical protein
MGGQTCTRYDGVPLRRDNVIAKVGLLQMNLPSVEEDDWHENRSMATIRGTLTEELFQT